MFEIRKAGTTVLAPAIGLDSTQMPTIGWSQVQATPAPDWQEVGTYPGPRGNEKIISGASPLEGVPIIDEPAIPEEVLWCAEHDCGVDQCKGMHR